MGRQLFIVKMLDKNIIRETEAMFGSFFKGFSMVFENGPGRVFDGFWKVFWRLWENYQKWFFDGFWSNLDDPVSGRLPHQNFKLIFVVQL